MSSTMKAALRSEYGQPDVLAIREIAVPTPKDDEVLVRIHSATANRTDCHILTGLPLYMRLMTGLLRPKLAITGTDFAGEIVSIGREVKTFKPGDHVIGFEFLGLQSHAEFLTIKSTADLIMISESIPYNHAAACIEGAFYALSVVNKIKPKAGQTAMVVGATGAIGSAILQFFKFYGLHVTAVCAAENNDLVRSLGADRLIDYKTQDFTKDEERFDFVFDAIGKYSFKKCKSLLKEKGLYASSGAPNPVNIFLTSLAGGPREVFCPPKDFKGCMTFVQKLLEAGKFKPVIDRTYELERISDAFDYVSRGLKIGNVVISMPK